MSDPQVAGVLGPRYEGAGSWPATGWGAMQVHSFWGRMLVCAFLDPSKKLLCSVLGWYLSDAVSEQILRGQFLGGSEPGLQHQLVRSAAGAVTRPLHPVRLKIGGIKIEDCCGFRT